MANIKWNLSHGRNRKEIEYYEKKSITRGDFKVKCQRQNLNFNDFLEIESGDERGTNKKYFYKKK